MRKITKHLPNILTLSRIFIIPIFVLSFFFEGNFSNFFGAGLFVLASLTDFFDGFLARILNVQSNFGKVLDPIADKLLVATAIIMLVYINDNNLIITLSGIVILCREILVSGLREFLAEISVSMPVSRLAKWKTAFQMTAITILILGSEASGFAFLNMIGEGGLVFAAILTIITGYAYFNSGMKHMGDRK